MGVESSEDKTGADGVTPEDFDASGNKEAVEIQINALHETAERKRTAAVKIRKIADEYEKSDYQVWHGLSDFAFELEQTANRKDREGNKWREEFNESKKS